MPHSEERGDGRNGGERWSPVRLGLGFWRGQRERGGTASSERRQGNVGGLLKELGGRGELEGALAWEIHVKQVLSILRKEKLFRSEEHTSELQSLRRIAYAVFCLKKKFF